MIVEPSPETVIRFIAIYGHGLGFPFTQLILGYGFEEEGIMHSSLKNIYTLDYEGPLYAGYFGLKNGMIRVAVAGSSTLVIPPSTERNKKVEDEVNGSPRGSLLRAAFSLH